jgi:hypothetical protein
MVFFFIEFVIKIFAFDKAYGIKFKEDNVKEDPWECVVHYILQYPTLSKLTK